MAASIYPQPYAQVQASIAGGAPVIGGQSVAPGQTLALSGVSTVGWNQALWEIVDYPVGWSVPAGWTMMSSGIIQFTGSSAIPNPPQFTLPTVAFWGKWGFRLTVNNGVDPNGLGNNPQTGAPNPRMVDSSFAVSIPSLNLLRDMFVGEQSQFGGIPNEQWVRDYKWNLRKIDAFMSIGGGGGGGSGISFIPVTGPATVAAQPGFTYGCDVTAGAITFTTASVTVTSPPYQKFGVLSWKSDPSVGGHGIAVDASNGNIQDPENIGNYSGSAVALTVLGSGATWFYDGANLVLTA